MFTQFFGSFLLNRKIVSPANLRVALEKKDTTRVKLGVLAINAGYMTAKQVDAVHKKQATVDKRIGDIAVDMGYLTERKSKSFFRARRPDAFYSDRRSLIWAVLQTRSLKPFSTTTKKKTDLPTRTSAAKATKRQKMLFLLSSLSRANTRIIALNM